MKKGTYDMKFDQRVSCGSLNMDHTGRHVLLAGWVDDSSCNPQA